MNEYNVIAGVYDKINSGVDYGRWSGYAESMFDKYLPTKPELVLDLACGTGSMTLALAERGYDMIGVDLSEDMLAVALDRTYDMVDNGKLPEEGRRPLFLCQDIRSFELYGTVGAAVCCLDSLNYLIGDGELQGVFATVHNYLDPNGLFLFDMNTPYKFENVYGCNSYVYELEEDDGGDSFCVWQNFYDGESRICDFFLTLFSRRDNGLYSREDEEQRERCYSFEEIASALSAAGFELISVGNGYTEEGREALSDTTPGSLPTDTERWYFVARCIK